MKQAEFEALTLKEVEERTAAEPDPQQGKPEYFDRPWTQLRDEMVTSGAKTVADLPADRVSIFYHSTKSVYGSVMNMLKDLFGGTSSG